MSIDVLKNRLNDVLKKFDSLAVACSGGTDSTLLSKVASEIFGDRFLAIHIFSSFTPRKENEFIKKWARENGIKLKIIETDILKNKNVKENSVRRCYYCKRAIMESVINEARHHQIHLIADGTNLDDYNDFRPGLEAAKEFRIQHPFVEAGFGKRKIRLLARHYSLPNWNTPASACLASRIVFGKELDSDLLKQIDLGEEFLTSLGVSSCRLRILEDGVSIEVNPLHIYKIIKSRAEIIKHLSGLGFRKIMVDLKGYRQGSLNPRAQLEN